MIRKTTRSVRAWAWSARGTQEQGQTLDKIGIRATERKGTCASKYLVRHAGVTGSYFNQVVLFSRCTMHDTWSRDKGAHFENVVVPVVAVLWRTLLYPGTIRNLYLHSEEDFNTAISSKMVQSFEHFYIRVLKSTFNLVSHDFHRGTSSSFELDLCIFMDSVRQWVRDGLGTEARRL